MYNRNKLSNSTTGSLKFFLMMNTQKINEKKKNTLLILKERVSLHKLTTLKRNIPLFQ